jgi:hypothetical protein
MSGYDYATTIAIKDLIDDLSGKAARRHHPPDRYGIVTAINRAARIAHVQYPGDEESVPIFMGSHQPGRVGDRVRVMGRNGDRHLAEVVEGTPYIGDANRGITFTAPNIVFPGISFEVAGESRFTVNEGFVGTSVPFLGLGGVISSDVSATSFTLNGHPLPRIKVGTAIVPTNGSSAASVTQAVVFTGTAFPSAPIVLVSNATDAGANLNHYSLAAYGETATGFTLRANKKDTATAASTNLTVRWIALLP